MASVGIVKRLEYHPVNGEFQLLRISFDGLADIFGIQGYLAPLFSWLLFLRGQQYRSVEQAGDVLLIHYRIQMELEWHFQFNHIAVPPVAAYFKVGTRLR